MALNLFCYTSLQMEPLKAAISVLIENNGNYFQDAFHIYEPWLLDGSSREDEISREVARDEGFEATTLFLVLVVNKDRAEELGDVADAIRATLSPERVLILFENETRM